MRASAAHAKIAILGGVQSAARGRVIPRFISHCRGSAGAPMANILWYCCLVPATIVPMRARSRALRRLLIG